MRLAGNTVRGIAQASVGDEASLALFIDFLEDRPLDARAYGVQLDGGGRIDPEDARRLLAQIVIVRVALNRGSQQPIIFQILPSQIHVDEVPWSRHEGAGLGRLDYERA